MTLHDRTAHDRTAHDRQGTSTDPELRLTATLMTVELLQNNRKLVDRISFHQIDKICTLVKQKMVKLV